MNIITILLPFLCVGLVDDAVVERLFDQAVLVVLPGSEKAFFKLIIGQVFDPVSAGGEKLDCVGNRNDWRTAIAGPRIFF